MQNLNDEAAQEQAAADDQHNAAQCHVADEELSAYYARVDAERDLDIQRVKVKRRFDHYDAMRAAISVLLLGEGRAR